jgi:membrane protein DedA with SNARE-associated domain
MLHLTHWIGHYKYAGIFFLQSLGMLGLPMPDESTMMFLGYLVFKGKLQFVFTVAAAFLGNIFGSTMAFFIGKSFGILVLKKHGSRVGITPERIENAHNWFRHIGKWLLSIGYIIPGIRNIMAYIAGTSKLEYWMFAVFAYSGSLLWTTGFIYSGVWLGNGWKRISSNWDHYILPLILAGLGLCLFYLCIWWFLKRIRHSSPEKNSCVKNEPKEKKDLPC